MIAERSGFVSNIFRALARRPAELRAFLDYHDALMNLETCSQDRGDGSAAGGLSKAERELVAVATSGANHCTPCGVLGHMCGQSFTAGYRWTGPARKPAWRASARTARPW
jgi:uncharacterized peroxidase-related enzyme